VPTGNSGAGSGIAEAIKKPWSLTNQASGRRLLEPEGQDLCRLPAVLQLGAVHQSPVLASPIQRSEQEADRAPAALGFVSLRFADEGPFRTPNEAEASLHAPGAPGIEPHAAI